MHTTSQTRDDPEIRLRIATPPRVGRILREGKSSNVFSVQDLERGLIFYEHTGRETGLRGDIDHFNLTLLNETEAWIREGRSYEGMGFPSYFCIASLHGGSFEQNLTA